MPDRYLRAAVTSIQEAAGGAKCIDLIGHSQGGFLVRAYTQLYSWKDDCPRVRRLYSLAGVQAGYYCYESCGSIKKGSPLMPIAHMLTQPTVVYSNFAKLTVVPSTEWKDPMAMDHYSKSDILIAQINGEAISSPNVTENNRTRTVAVGREQIVQLDRFYTFYSPADQIISPPEAEKFDFYKNGSRTEIEPFEQSVLYSEDRIGLRELKNLGRWVTFQVDGYLHRDFVDERATEFYQNCLRPLLLRLPGDEDYAPNCGKKLN